MFAYVLMLFAATTDLPPKTAEALEGVLLCEDGSKAESVANCPGKRPDPDLVAVESEEPLPPNEAPVSFVLPPPTDGSTLPIPKAWRLTKQAWSAAAKSSYPADTRIWIA
jgi:hypothetical protein